MKRMLAGGGLAILLPMLLALGTTGCAGPGYQPAQGTAGQACEDRSGRSTGSRLSRRTCIERKEGA